MLTPREFCEKMRISYDTFKRWVRRGYIHVIRTPSGRIRVPESELKRLLEKSNSYEGRMQ